VISQSHNFIDVLSSTLIYHHQIVKASVWCESTALAFIVTRCLLLHPL